MCFCAEINGINRVSKRKLTKRIILWMCFLSALFCFYPRYYYVLPEAADISYVQQPQTKHEGVGVYVINLDRCPERYAYVMQSVSQLGLPTHRISAVDGNLLTQDDLGKKVDIEQLQFYEKRLNVGVVGCSLSHIKTWQTFLESNYEFALIFEDDISFEPKRLRTAIDGILANIKFWDVCTFHMHRESNHKPSFFDVRPNFNLKQIGDHILCIYAQKITGASCYILNRKAAMEYVKKAFPIVLPIDMYYSRSWEFDLNFVGVEPHIVYSSFGESCIDQTDNISNTKTTRSDNFISIIKHAMYRKQLRFIFLLTGLKQWLFNKYFA